MSDTTTITPATALQGAGPRRAPGRVLALVGMLTILLVAAAARRLLARYEVAGLSMSPTLRPGDWLICESISLHFGQARRGQIVVFESPRRAGLTSIKRILAVEGDTISIDSEGNVRLSRELGSHEAPAPSQGEEVEVGAGDVFVVGDNLAASTDSRDFGPVPVASITGTARLRYRSESSLRPVALRGAPRPDEKA